MIVGVLSLQYRLHGNGSLKGKRKVANSLKQKLRNKFNVAVSEVDAHDVHDTLVLAAVTVGPDRGIVEKRLQKAVGLAEAATWAELVYDDIVCFGE